MKATGEPKRILYCDTIELGHRVTQYLRSLIPPSLNRMALVRHMHSMNCADCKHEGLTALRESFDGEARQTLIFVTTAILEVGIDIPDIHDVIMYPTPRSLSSVIQRAGRPARGQVVTRGRAIIYIKHSDLEAARAYSSMDHADPRLMEVQSSAKSLEDQRPMEISSCGAEPIEDDRGEPIIRSRTSPDDAVMLASAAPLVSQMTSNLFTIEAANTTSRRQKKHAQSAKSCISLLLAISAHVRKMCITRQINIVYGNPGFKQDCGRCSSCAPESIPTARVPFPSQRPKQNGVRITSEMPATRSKPTGV